MVEGVFAGDIASGLADDDGKLGTSGMEDPGTSVTPTFFFCARSPSAM